MRRTAVPGNCPLHTLPILLLLAVFFAIPSRLHAQQFDFSRELRFAQYLLDKEAGKEAMQVLEQIDTAQLSPDRKDSLFFMLGWTSYSGKQLDKAIGWLLKVSPASPQYERSRFFSAYCQAFRGRTDSAIGVLRQLELSDSVRNELRSLQLAGMALLKRNYPDWLALRGQFTYSSYIFTKEERRMGHYYDMLSGFRHKSPLLAGVYSALVPGLGKFYAGKKKQAIAAFLPVISLAALTYEAYRKDGVKSARFIGFGTLFSVFYIGNIWGSTLAVRIRRNEFNKEYDNKILFDMHIPLRNFFN